MSVAAQCYTLNLTKPNATNCLITEDPSLKLSIVKVARDQCVLGSLLALWGSKMRGLGNEVVFEGVPCPSTEPCPEFL